MKRIIEQMKKAIEHIVFGLLISGIFGILAFMILLIPIFFSKELIEIILRISVFILFELGLFISGIIFSIKDNREQKNIEVSKK